MTSLIRYCPSKKKRHTSNPKVSFTNPSDFAISFNFHASYIDEDDYQPSAELLAALNTLPPELLDVKMEAGEEELKPQVKSEPIEREIGGTWQSYFIIPFKPGRANNELMNELCRL